MANISVLDLILGVKSPCEIIKRTVNHNQRRIDVWVAMQASLASQDVPTRSSWFGFKKAAPKVVQPLVTHDLTKFNSWRHLDLGDWHMVVHTPRPTPSAMLDQPWTGVVGQHFSHSLSRVIFSMLAEGASLAVICTALKVNLTDLLKYKFALDNGQIGVLQQGVVLPQTAAFSIETRPGSGTTVVPALDDEAWTAIATGKLDIEIKTLSLRLLLTKVRSQYRMAADDEVRTLHLRDLHRYFEKNQRLLTHELAQINLKK
jgi:hypothetical protein